MNVKIETKANIEIIVNNSENFQILKEFLLKKEIYLKEDFEGTTYFFKDVKEEDKSELAFLIDLTTTEDISRTLLSLFFEKDFDLIEIKFIETDTRSFI